MWRKKIKSFSESTPLVYLGYTHFRILKFVLLLLISQSLTFSRQCRYPRFAQVTISRRGIQIKHPDLIIIIIMNIVLIFSKLASSFSRFVTDVNLLRQLYIYIYIFFNSWQKKSERSKRWHAARNNQCLYYFIRF